MIAITSDNPEKQAIEFAAREKFQHLDESLKVEFKRIYDSGDKGNSFRLLYANGFTLDEASRFIMFMDDLISD